MRAMYTRWVGGQRVQLKWAGGSAGLLAVIASEYTVMGGQHGEGRKEAGSTRCLPVPKMQPGV